MRWLWTSADSCKGRASQPLGRTSATITQGTAPLRTASHPAAAAAELARCRLAEAIVASWGGQFERAIAAAEESLRYEASRPGPSATMHAAQS